MGATSGKVCVNAPHVGGAEHRGSPHASPPSTALRGLSAVAVAGVAAVLAVLAPAAGASAAEVPLSVTDQAVADRLATRVAGADPRQGPGRRRHRRGHRAGASGRTPQPRRRSRRPTPRSSPRSTPWRRSARRTRFTTSVMTGSTARRIVLVGGGDPSLSARQLGGMARTVAAACAGQGLHPGPRRGRRLALPGAHLGRSAGSGRYTIEDVSPVRALVVDQHRRWDTSLDAGAVFARKLEKWGLNVRRVARAVRPATSTVVTERTASTWPPRSRRC